MGLGVPRICGNRIVRGATSLCIRPFVYVVQKHERRGMQVHRCCRVQSLNCYPRSIPEVIHMPCPVLRRKRGDIITRKYIVVVQLLVRGKIQGRLHDKSISEETCAVKGSKQNLGSDSNTVKQHCKAVLYICTIHSYLGSENGSQQRLVLRTELQGFLLLQ